MKTKAADLVQSIDKLLRDNHIFASVYSDGDIVFVEIEWGDWKHEHLRADFLVAENFSPVFYTKEITQEDGSDCFSAVHKYLF